MFISDTESSSRPEKVAVSAVDRSVRLTDNVQEVVREEDGEKYTVYVYDEVVFELPYDREESAESIEQNFDGWWLYGKNESQEEMTLEERIQILENVILGGIANV